jgi:glycosyltransferase involved in cell wall biosynthesis
MVRVLIFDTSSRLGAVGGAQRVAANLFYELPKRGIETFYLGYKTDYFKGDSPNIMFLTESKQKKLKDLGERSKFQSLLESRIIRMGYYSFYSLKGINITEMKEFVESVKPDIVLASSILDYIILKRLKPYFGSATKIIYIEHANASGKYSGAFDYNIMQLTFGTGSFVGLEKARKRFFSFFDGVIALNMEQYNSVKKYNKNVTIIHSSSLLADKKPTESRLESFKRKHGIHKGLKVVLYLGRLAEAQKNVSLLIKAFIAEPDPELRLFIVGEGKSKPLYEEMSKSDKRIKIVGRVPESELPYYYSVSNLYVLPSIWESFNATFIEAASFGSPLLLSKNAVNSDIKQKFEKRLLLFNPNDVEELREKMKLALSNKIVRSSLIKLSKDIAFEYSKRVQMDAYASAIKKLYYSGSLE